MIWNILFGFAFASAVSLVAWRLHALDAGGAVSAWIAGGIIFGFGGLAPSAALLAFFLSGSVLSSLPEHRRTGPLLLKKELAGGYARNWKQVVANGFVPVAAIIAARLVPSREPLFLHAFYGSVAAACADSWGTEIGTRYGNRVRDIITGHDLTPGLSGGVSLRGMAGSITGAALIAFAAALPLTGSIVAGEAWAILIAGTLGAVADSILGCSVQAKYRYSDSKEIFEVSPPSDSGTRQAILIAGYKNIKNNTVNFAASTIGALIVILILDIR
jgi:uncharacterized protein (TIGR00297 family)